MLKIRMQTWLGLFVAAVCLLLTAIAGLWLYPSATPAPGPAHVPSVADAYSLA